ncbi:hypothetical protein IH980_04445 [Patescibacteria group bacterium]|nr:hypothetical protein [Patescibacteria group bacterium]
MSGVSELRFGERGSREPYPADTANRWVNQQGPVLLEKSSGGLRPIHELVGEYREKSLLFLTPDSDTFWRTRIGGSFPEVVFRWQTRLTAILNLTSHGL